MRDWKGAAAMGRLMAAALMGAFAWLGAAAAASVATHHPTGEFSQFSECPLSRQAITDCVYSVSNAGRLSVGERVVAIKNPIVFRGGFDGIGMVSFFGAENGETLSKAAQPIPGGLNGASGPSWWPQWLQEAFDELIGEGSTGVSATVELAAPATQIELSTANLLTAKGTALGLPVKLKLENPALGANCYVGSDSEPVEIEFTSGKSNGLMGRPGQFLSNKAFTLHTVVGGKLVNGTFAAPGAQGCGGVYSYYIDPLVNSVLGLPSASGRNTGILEGKYQDAAASSVRESEAKG